MTRNIYDEVTAKIITMLENNPGPFKTPWFGGSGMPRNKITGNAYQGVNVLNLWASGQPSNTWATYRQWSSIGAQVMAGERSTSICYVGTIAPREGAEPGSKGPVFLKTSAVFSAAQVSGYVEPEARTVSLAERLASVDAFIAATGARVAHSPGRAFYIPGADRISVPALADFQTAEAYYSVLLHELTHWTSAPSRLDRQLGKRFGDQAYAAEELIAELGAAFLCAELGISAEPRLDHAQYLASWIAVLKADNKAIFTAASAASKAAKYLGEFPRIALAA